MSSDKIKVYAIEVEQYDDFETNDYIREDVYQLNLLIVKQFELVGRSNYVRNKS